MDYKRRSIDFLKEYKVQGITLDSLIEIIKSQGYQVIPFNTFERVESTELLLEELELKQYSMVNKAFTFVQGSIKIIFVDDTLLDKDKLYALIHEEGHIYCGHMDRYTCSAANVEDEHEANEFTHYVLNPPGIYRIQYFLSKNKKQCIITLLIVLALIVVPIVCKQVKSSMLAASNEYSKTLDYYITESGEKYHRKDCRVIKGKENIRRITEEEYNSGKYDPCKICNP